LRGKKGKGKDNQKEEAKKKQWTKNPISLKESESTVINYSLESNQILAECIL
jgi:hypothetical protein